MEKTDKIAVLIPCFNESATVAKVVSDFKQALPDAVIYVSAGERKCYQAYVP